MSQEKVAKAFNDVIAGWIYGIREYPGEIYPELIYAVIKEMKQDLWMAIECLHIFDPVEIAEQVISAAKYLVDEKEVVFNLLAQLPSPGILKTEDQLFVLAQIVDKVEQRYEGALARLERKWQGQESSL